METFEHLRGSRLVLLTSRDLAAARAVHRPVRMSFDALGDGLLQTVDGGPLARRLDACPDVRVARSDLRGRPAGSDQPGRAVRDAQRATGRIAAIGRLLGVKLVRYRVSPAEEPTPWSAP